MKKSNICIIPVNEEYGYRYWYWVYPDTISKLIKDWKRGHAPINYFNPSCSEFKGRLVQVAYENKSCKIFCDLYEKLDVICHIHEPEDTWLKVGTKYFSPFGENILCSTCSVL